MLALVTSLALLGAAPPDVADHADEAPSLAAVGDVIFKAQVCETFGYGVDWERLRTWSDAARDSAVAADPALTIDTAQAKIDRKVTSNFKVIFALYWQGVVTGSRPASELDEKQFRFVKIFRKTCEQVAGSQEVGEYFVPPEQPPAASEVIARVKDGFLRTRDRT